MTDFSDFREASPHKVMIDLETLGLSPRAAIISIGACMFHPHSDNLDGMFYCVVDSESQRNQIGRQDREFDPKTIEWWKTQPPVARDILDDPSIERLHLDEALKRLAEWFPLGAEVYGNGSDFDVAKLDDAYAQVPRPSPWEFYNVRCYRTLKSLPGASAAPKPMRTNVHNALADAIYQARHMQAIYREMGWVA